MYKPSSKTPQIVDVPSMSFAMVSGSGDPNTSVDFKDSIEALYGLSYGIKMLPKKGITVPGYREYSVPPLEGIWNYSGNGIWDASRKADLVWTIMIRQPDFVSPALFEKVKASVMARKSDNNSRIAEIRLDSMSKGLCCQLMHIGPFDEEPESFDRMDTFIADEGFLRTELSHHEIYLNDFRRVAPEKLRTILRFRIAGKARE